MTLLTSTTPKFGAHIGHCVSCVCGTHSVPETTGQSADKRGCALQASAAPNLRVFVLGALSRDRDALHVYMGDLVKFRAFPVPTLATLNIGLTWDYVLYAIPITWE